MGLEVFTGLLGCETMQCHHGTQQHKQTACDSSALPDPALT